MPPLVRRLYPARCERYELVAQIDEGHRAANPASEVELEEAPVPLKRFIDVIDLDRNVIDPDQPGHRKRP